MLFFHMKLAGEKNFYFFLILRPLKKKLHKHIIDWDLFTIRTNIKTPIVNVMLRYFFQKLKEHMMVKLFFLLFNKLS